MERISRSGNIHRRTMQVLSRLQHNLEDLLNITVWNTRIVWITACILQDRTVFGTPQYLMVFLHASVHTLRSSRRPGAAPLGTRTRFIPWEAAEPGVAPPAPFCGLPELCIMLPADDGWGRTTVVRCSGYQQHRKWNKTKQTVQSV